VQIEEVDFFKLLRDMLGDYEFACVRLASALNSKVRTHLVSSGTTPFVFDR
jgi:hypothetical protein